MVQFDLQAKRQHRQTPVDAHQNQIILESMERPADACMGIPCTEPSPSLFLTTDASLLGWGTHLNDLTAQDKWSPSKTCLHINLLKLRAVRNVCVHFRLLIRDTHTKVMTDNIACMYYINHQGGTSGSTKAMELVYFLQCYNISSLTTRSTQHDSGQSQPQIPTQPQVGDRLRHILRYSDIFRQWGTLIIDLFTTYQNKECPRYCSRVGIGQHIMGDACLLS